MSLSRSLNLFSSSSILFSLSCCIFMSCSTFCSCTSSSTIRLIPFSSDGDTFSNFSIIVSIPIYVNLLTSVVFISCNLSNIYSFIDLPQPNSPSLDIILQNLYPLSPFAPYTGIIMSSCIASLSGSLVAIYAPAVYVGFLSFNKILPVSTTPLSFIPS